MSERTNTNHQHLNRRVMRPSWSLLLQIEICDELLSPLHIGGQRNDQEKYTDLQVGVDQGGIQWPALRSMAVWEAATPGRAPQGRGDTPGVAGSTTGVTYRRPAVPCMRATTEQTRKHMARPARADNSFQLIADQA